MSDVPKVYVVLDQPGLKIEVRRRGGGDVVQHYILEINGQFAMDDSSSAAWTHRRMFPAETYPDLHAWIAEVEELSRQKYKKLHPEWTG